MGHKAMVLTGAGRFTLFIRRPSISSGQISSGQKFVLSPSLLVLETEEISDGISWV